MLDPKHFVVIAGDANKWKKNLKNLLNEGLDLVEIQKRQYTKGLRMAMLVQGGPDSLFCVRAISSLQENMFVVGGWTRKDKAIEMGTEWACEDPNNRVFFAMRSLMQEEMIK